MTIKLDSEGTESSVTSVKTEASEKSSVVVKVESNENATIKLGVGNAGSAVVKIKEDQTAQEVKVELQEEIIYMGGSGYPLTVAVAKIEGGHRITITDIDGKKTFDIMNGPQGLQVKPVLLVHKAR